MKINVTLTIIQGGMREFERTGVYPEYLLFYLPEYKRSWRVKLRKHTQNGYLKLNGETHFEYAYKNGKCKLRNIGSNSWTNIPDVLLMMCD
jgi:hypothetical protein